MAKNKLPTAKVTDTMAIAPDQASAARERRYRAEDALRTITEAEKHKADKGLMKDVKMVAREKIKDMSKVCGK